MRSLSNIIKSDFVLYDREPMLINIKTAVEKTQDDVDDIEIESEKSRKALEDAEKILRSAVTEADDIAKRGRVEAQLAFFNAVEEKKQLGYQDGLKKGRPEGESQAAKKVSAAAAHVIERISSLDASYTSNMAEVKSDCLDFAFGLAENILGTQIDRGSDDYQRLIGKFLCSKSCKATIEVDGCAYPFETLRTDGLVPCSDGLQGILVCHDEPCADEETEDETAESFEQSSLSEDSENEPEPEVVEPVNIVLPEEPDDSEENVDMQEMQNEGEPENSPEDDQKYDAEEDYQYEAEDEKNCEKFVFVRPSKRSAALSTNADAGGGFIFTGLAQLDQMSLKAILRKTEINDIVAALNGVDEDIKSTFVNALTRRMKEKVLDAIKYLGPVQQQEIDAARNRIVQIAADTIKTLERDESDV